MSIASRHGKKWNISETLQLQREYELLKLTPEQIAPLHGRSEMSIILKIEAEGFDTNNYEPPKTNTNKKCTKSPNIKDLNESISQLRIDVNSIKDTVADFLETHKSPSRPVTRAQASWGFY